MLLEFDTQSLPIGMTIESWYHIFSYFDMVLYDSRLGEKPKFVDNEGETIGDKMLIDLADNTLKNKAEELTGLTFEDETEQTRWPLSL